MPAKRHKGVTENEIGTQSVLQADIKKTRHFDVPGLMFDY
jgi:hypothetical protein